MHLGHPPRWKSSSGHPLLLAWCSGIGSDALGRCRPSASLFFHYDHIADPVSWFSHRYHVAIGTAIFIAMGTLREAHWTHPIRSVTPQALIQRASWIHCLICWVVVLWTGVHAGHAPQGRYSELHQSQAFTCRAWEELQLVLSSPNNTFRASFTVFRR